jgi:hypothetical protein
MLILRDLLRSLQTLFSDTRLGRQRAHWFGLTLLPVIVPSTSSMTSNLLRYTVAFHSKMAQAARSVSLYQSLTRLQRRLVRNDV